VCIIKRSNGYTTFIKIPLIDGFVEKPQEIKS
jgi:hypothetical protein